MGGTGFEFKLKLGSVIVVLDVFLSDSFPFLFVVIGLFARLDGLSLRFFFENGGEMSGGLS